MPGDSKYNLKWENGRTWLKPSKEGKGKAAYCSLCKTDFRINNSGIAQVRHHESTEKHNKLLKNANANSSFVTKDGQLALDRKQPTPKELTHQEKVMKAEIIQALHTIDANIPFTSTDSDGERFRLQFSDSQIAQDYKQARTKVKYVLQYGIVPIIKNNIKKDLSGKPFTFKFDETTTAQVKKQYDGYLTYFSDEGYVKTSYCGSLFVGHCPAEKLLEDINYFFETVGLDRDLFLACGMDGPSVNEKFQRKLYADLERRGTSFLLIDTCALHITNNGFGGLLKELKKVIDLDQFAIDIHFFFKYSAARREDYSAIEEITELTTHYMIRHVQTRWLSIQKVILRIVEQLVNLKQYFLKFLPTQQGFNYKDGVGSTVRYQRIKALLQSASFPPYALFVINIAQELRKFILLFQRKEPLIHLLHPKMLELIQKLLMRFVKPEIFTKKKTNGLISASKLTEIDFTDSTFQKVRVDCGTRANEAYKLLSPLDRKKFDETCLRCMGVLVNHLIQKLPITNQIIHDAKYISPLEHNNKNLPIALVRLAKEVGTSLGVSKTRKVFNLDNKATLSDLCDAVKGEAEMYLAEIIPEHFYLKDKIGDDVVILPPRRPSYWRDAFQIAGIDCDPEIESNMQRIEYYWRKVLQFRNDLGQPKYGKLWNLVKCITIISHGNAEPERGFSVNNRLLDIHGANIGEEMIRTIRTVKDCIINMGGVCEELITNEMLDSVAQSRQRYEKDMVEQKKRDEQKRKADEEYESSVKEASQKKEKLEQFDRDISTLKAGIDAAEMSIVSGNVELSELIRDKHMSREKLAQAQTKIEMGLKRKSDLQAEINNITERKRKLLD